MSIAELLAGNGRSSSAQRDRTVGVVVGIVKDIKDPKHLGRVKVDFPWLAKEGEEVADGQETRAHSYWARIALPMAGKGRGTFFLPEVGDEVLVAFEFGDFNRPMVLGSLWNYDDPPPEKMDSDGKNDIRAIHSRSGHKIILNDSSDNPSITIVDKTGENKIFIDSTKNAMEIKVKGDLTIDVGGNLSISAGQKITIKASQDVSAESQANLKLKATGNGAIEASGPLTVKSSAKLSLEGAGQAELKGAMVSVNGSGMTEVKGGLVKIN